MKKHSKSFWVKLISGVTLGTAAIVTTLSVMIPSYLEYKNYYDTAMADKAEKERLSKLPLEFLGITAELNDNVKYWDNETADPQNSDFTVKANFTEKGKDFSKKLSSREFKMEVPSDFAKKGGTIVFSYTYTPEKNSDDETDPESIEKKCELTLTLTEPDETVFKVIQKPTFEEAGYAENNKGTRKELEPLDDVHYDYVEKVSSGFGFFTHKASGIVIKVAITDSLGVFNADGTRFDYNNISCYFAKDIKNLKITFKDSKFVIAAEGDEPLSLGTIDGKKAAIEIQSGEFSLKGEVRAKKLVIKSGVKINLNGRILADYLLAEENSELDATWSAWNCIEIGVEGFAGLYGKATFADSVGGSTVVALGYDAKISLNDSSRIVVKNCAWFAGNFVGNNDGEHKGCLLFPKGYEQKEDKNYYVGDNCILDLSDCAQKGFCNMQTKEAVEYEVTKAPDATNPGIAKRPDGTEITLPVLNFTDYAASISGKDLVFQHNDTHVEIEISLQIASNLKIDGLTIDYDEETGSKFTVDKDKKIELSGTLSTDGLGSVIIAGEGSLSIKDGIIVKQGKSLTVNSEATLKVTKTDGDAIDVSGDASSGGTLNLFGKVDVIVAAGKTGINLQGNGPNTLHLANTSRVMISGGGYSIARFYGENAKVYYPSDATYEMEEKKITRGEDILLSFDGGILRLDFEKEN